MKEKKQNHSVDIGVLLLNIILSFFILMLAIGGLGARDNGFGLLLLLANISFNIAFSFLFKNRWFLRGFLLFSLLIHMFIMTVFVFSDGSPLINRVIVFLIIAAIITSIYAFFYRKMYKRLKNNT